MDNFVLRIYLGEIGNQCNYVVQATNQLNAQLQNGDTREFFRVIHSFLTHSSNVSKLLWPVKSGGDKAIIRGKELRKILGLPEKHVLANRTLRNHLEHYDNRLDEWVEQSSHHNYVDHNIGPMNSITGIDKKDFMRHFDPTTNKFIFRGEEFDIQAIVTGISQIIEKLNSVKLD